MVHKTKIELKIEYWSNPKFYYSPTMVKWLVKHYGEKPATVGEAAYVLRHEILFAASELPLIGRLLK